MLGGKIPDLGFGSEAMQFGEQKGWTLLLDAISDHNKIERTKNVIEKLQVEREEALIKKYGGGFCKFRRKKKKKKEDEETKKEKIRARVKEAIKNRDNRGNLDLRKQKKMKSEIA